MPTVAVVSLKGGVGKTTTAVHLAVAAHRAGLHVAVYDADPQGSAAARIEADKTLQIDVHRPAGKRWRADVDRLARQYDWVIVDTAPGESDVTAVTAVLAAADLAVIPCTPTGFDVHRLARTLELVTALDVPAGVLITMTDLRWVAHRELVEALDCDDTVNRFETVIPRTVRAAGSFERPIGGELFGYDSVWDEISTALKAG